MVNLIQKVKMIYQQKEYNRPKYSIKRLYIGAIVKCKGREFIGFGVWNNYYARCKDFAIFYKVNDSKYIHIKSGQELNVLDRATVGDYCVKSPKSYFETYVSQIREDRQTKNTKLSKCYIDDLETAQNMEWANGPIPMHNLFDA